MNEQVERHYASSDLIGAIRAGLQAAGKLLGKLKPEDLVAVDEFHVRGRPDGGLLPRGGRNGALGRA
jgi:hypothetical protein